MTYAAVVVRVNVLRDFTYPGEAMVPLGARPSQNGRVCFQSYGESARFVGGYDPVSRPFGRPFGRRYVQD
jgi:hypothetical protein